MAESLDTQLRERTQRFLLKDTRNQVTASRLRLSKIFEWYAEDFGDVRNYVAEQTGLAIDDQAEVSYLDYDWQINTRR